MSDSMTDISIRLFGGVFVGDGAGYYPGLELMNLVFCTEDETLLPQTETVRVKRLSHDFARRLTWNAEEFGEHPDRDKVITDQFAEEAIRHLLECLQLELKNIRQVPTWPRAHFLPYRKSLLHWDARPRGSRIQIERRYFRGGGALAYRVLRMDGDTDRLDRCRKGFAALFPDTDQNALDRVVTVLAKYAHADEDASVDTVEKRCETRSDDDLDDLLRDGTVNIVEHTELPPVVRIRALMTWIGFWTATVHHSRAAGLLADGKKSVLLCDCVGVHDQLRRASRRCLREIRELFTNHVAQVGGELTKKDKQSLERYFAQTASAVGLVNAYTGRRHFVLKLELKEALVLAGTSKGSQQPYEVFTHEWLYRRNRLVIGRRAAEESGLLESLDASIFEDNENEFARQLRSAGLLTQYSDSTRMVTTEGMA